MVTTQTKVLRIQHIPLDQYAKLSMIADKLGYRNEQELIRELIDNVISDDASRTLSLDRVMKEHDREFVEVHKSLNEIKEMMGRMMDVLIELLT